MSHLGLSNGMVVAVSLNPLASTSFVDPGLQELARGIVVGKYVAILSQIVRPFSLLSLNVADTHKPFLLRFRVQIRVEIPWRTFILLALECLTKTPITMKPSPWPFLFRPRRNTRMVEIHLC